MSFDRNPAPDEPPRSRPLLVLLHFLGSSTRSWSAVIPRLSARFECRSVDLPGFGDAVAEVGYALDEMADAVASVVRAAAPRCWVIAGHSMGAKVAAVLARRSENGDPDLAGLSHLVLLAGSPPCPEPMDEAKRSTMMSWFTGDREACRAQAETYIDENVGAPLEPAVHEEAVDDVLRMDRAAWVAWLERGSRDDWADRIGLLRVPALIMAGEHDSNLGPEAQARLMAPHFASSRLVTLPGARHLLPQERAPEVAALILAHVEQTGPGIPPDYRALIGTDRVSARTRAVLLARGEPDDPGYTPQAMTVAALATLRAVVARVVPQPGVQPIDLAARIDDALANGPGDGWRFARLPPDRDAYATALPTLDKAARDTFGQGFPALQAVQQDQLLETLAQGELPVMVDGGQTLLPPDVMALWFDDLRAAAVQAYVGHPSTLARLGYSGIANGGDGIRKQGFVAVGPNEREPWEPLPATDPVS